MHVTVLHFEEVDRIRREGKITVFLVTLEVRSKCDCRPTVIMIMYRTPSQYCRAFSLRHVKPHAHAGPLQYGQTLRFGEITRKKKRYAGAL